MRRVKLLWLRIVRRLRSDRFFQLKPPFRGPGWYFDVRGGEPWGPYATLHDAKLVAERYASACQMEEDAGGRDDAALSQVTVS